MNRPMRARRGQILFLEFMISLPIFIILIISMTTFHKFYMATFAAGQDARRLAWISTQEEIHRKPYNIAQMRSKDMNEALASEAARRGGLRTRFKVRTRVGIAKKSVVAPYFLGDSEAYNRVQVTQDSWSFQEIRARSLEEREPNPDTGRIDGQNARTIQRMQQPIVPPNVNQGKVPDDGYSKPDWSLMHGQSSDPVMQKYRERAPMPYGREEPGDSAASLLYGESMAGEMSGYIEL